MSGGDSDVDRLWFLNEVTEEMAHDQAVPEVLRPFQNEYIQRKAQLLERRRKGLLEEYEQALNGAIEDKSFLDGDLD